MPLVSHRDPSEHSVQIVVTELGVADLRGKDPHERAPLIVNNCAHPAYLNLTSAGHAPLSLSLAMHREFLASGDMRNIDWAKCQ